MLNPEDLFSPDSLYTELGVEHDAYVQSAYLAPQNEHDPGKIILKMIKKKFF